MSTQSNTVPESPLDSQATATAAVAETRLLYWSIRREVWENRSIYIAPLVVAAVVLFGFLISTIHLPAKMRALPTLDPVKQRTQISMPFNLAAFLILLTAFIAGVFYCLDALHGEGRDRSILFWKSLPVSDLTAVLSKASVPLVVLPLLVFAIIVATQLIMLWLSTAVLLANGLSIAALWTQLNLWESSQALFYGLIAMALWHAPLYAWLLLVSAWARRTPLFWAVLPLGAICILEKIALNRTHFASLLLYRLIGWFTAIFRFQAPGTVPLHPLAQLTPGRFLTTPGLWIGLVFAAIFLAGAARLRRYRSPI